MSRYSLHKNVQTGAIEAVKDGWSWPAFFFGFAWAFSRGMPAIALGLIGFQLVAGFVIGLIIGPRAEAANVALLIVGLLYSSYCAAHGNEWLRNALIRRGFSRLGEVDAGSEAAALEAQSRAAPGAVPTTDSIADRQVPGTASAI